MRILTEKDREEFCVSAGGKRDVKACIKRLEDFGIHCVLRRMDLEPEYIADIWQKAEDELLETKEIGDNYRKLRALAQE